jgi:H+/Cl- antiporter ClcA
MVRVIGAVLALFAFLVVCLVGIVQHLSGESVAVGTVLLRGGLVALLFLAVGAVLGAIGVRVVRPPQRPSPPAPVPRPESASAPAQKPL